VSRKEKLLAMFQREAQEQLEILRAGLDELAMGACESATLSEMYRAAHTLKGNSGAAGLDGVEGITHALEDLFGVFNEGKLQPTPDMADKAHQALDGVEQLIESAVEDKPVNFDVQVLTSEIESMIGEEEKVEKVSDSSLQLEETELTELAAAEQVYLLTVKLIEQVQMPGVRAALLMEKISATGFEIFSTFPEREKIETGEPGEIFKLILTGQDVPAEEVTALLADDDEVASSELEELPAELPELKERFFQKNNQRSTAPAQRSIKPVSTVRVDAEILDSLLNSLSELTVQRLRLESHAPDTPDLEREFLRLQRQLEALQDQITKTRLMSVNHVFRRFPRLVRDLERELDKQIELKLEGEETELDKKLVDLLGDPLIHIIRNAVDHGIEPPEERCSAGKPEQGLIKLAARHNDGRVEIEVVDDGRGLDPEEIAAKAIEKGIVDSEIVENMGPDEKIQLVTEPGFSTAEEVTDLSGRGVGMDVVKTTVEKFRGSLEISSTPGEGTTVCISFPLTLAVIEAFLVEAGNSQFALPLEQVKTTRLISREQISDDSAGRYCEIDGEKLPCDHILNVFDSERQIKLAEDRHYSLVLLDKLEGEFGLIFDEITARESVVVKPLSQFIRGFDGYSGTTFLGDGRATFILNPAEKLEAIGKV